MPVWHYTPIPCDEPPTQKMRRDAQRHADNTGEAVTIADERGIEFDTYWPEV